MEVKNIIGNKDIKAVCIDFCSNETRYTEPNSRTVHIPRDIWSDFINRKNFHRMESIPLFIGIRNAKNRKGKKFYFGRVEPSVDTVNSNHTMALLPKWLFECLDMDMMDATIDIVYVPMPQDVDRIILKGNNSSYVNTDVKSELEEQMGSWNCINLNETFKVRDVTFTITDLKTSENKTIEFGSIFNLEEVKIEFEEPDDIRELNEKLEREIKLDERKQRTLQNANNKLTTDSSNFVTKASKFSKTSKYAPFQGDSFKINSSTNDQSKVKFGSNISGFNQKTDEDSTYVPFQGTGLKINSITNKHLTKAELLEARLKRLNNM